MYVRRNKGGKYRKRIVLKYFFILGWLVLFIEFSSQYYIPVGTQRRNNVVSRHWINVESCCFNVVCLLGMNQLRWVLVSMVPDAADLKNT